MPICMTSHFAFQYHKSNKKIIMRLLPPFPCINGERKLTSSYNLGTAIWCRKKQNYRNEKNKKCINE